MYPNMVPSVLKFNVCTKSPENLIKMQILQRQGWDEAELLRVMLLLLGVDHT